MDSLNALDMIQQKKKKPIDMTLYIVIYIYIKLRGNIYNNFIWSGHLIQTKVHQTFFQYLRGENYLTQINWTIDCETSIKQIEVQILAELFTHTQPTISTSFKYPTRGSWPRHDHDRQAGFPLQLHEQNINSLIHPKKHINLLI